MPTLILFLIIAVLFILAVHSLAKGKSSCGECSCNCAIKQNMDDKSHHSHS